jgi:hypothetical protein
MDETDQPLRFPPELVPPSPPEPRRLNTDEILAFAQREGITFRLKFGILLVEADRPLSPDALATIRHNKDFIEALILLHDRESDHHGLACFRPAYAILAQAKFAGAFFDLDRNGRLIVRNREKLAPELRGRIERNRHLITWLFEMVPDLALEHSRYLARVRNGWNNMMGSQPVH